MYSVKEMFYTLQGEGSHAGRPAVFCRFSGCNLWSGREQDRATAVCSFCDTDFVGIDGQNGGKFATAQLLAQRIQSFWPAPEGIPFVVFTGGEPALQLDSQLVGAMHDVGFEVAIETNGTKPLPDGIDWVCVSPKANAEVIITQGDELKLVYPQPLAMPNQFDHLDFRHRYLQALDDENQKQHLLQVVDYCMRHPRWKMSLQTHKIVGID